MQWILNLDELLKSAIVLFSEICKYWYMCLCQWTNSEWNCKFITSIVAVCFWMMEKSGVSEMSNFITLELIGVIFERWQLRDVVIHQIAFSTTPSPTPRAVRVCATKFVFGPWPWNICHKVKEDLDGLDPFSCKKMNKFLALPSPIH